LSVSKCTATACGASCAPLCKHACRVLTKARRRRLGPSTSGLQRRSERTQVICGAHAKVLYIDREHFAAARVRWVAAARVGRVRNPHLAAAAHASSSVGAPGRAGRPGAPRANLPSRTPQRQDRPRTDRGRLATGESMGGRSSSGDGAGGERGGGGNASTAPTASQYALRLGRMRTACAKPSQSSAWRWRSSARRTAQRRERRRRTLTGLRHCSSVRGAAAGRRAQLSGHPRDGCQPGGAAAGQTPGLAAATPRARGGALGRTSPDPNPTQPNGGSRRAPASSSVLSSEQASASDHSSAPAAWHASSSACASSAAAASVTTGSSRSAAASAARPRGSTTF